MLKQVLKQVPKQVLKAGAKAGGAKATAKATAAALAVLRSARKGRTLHQFKTLPSRKGSKKGRQEIKTQQKT